MTVMMKFEYRSNLVTKWTFGKLAKIVRRRGMERHLEVNIPLHFESNVKTRLGGEYKFTPRTVPYQIWKGRQVGHRTPNLLTGELRRNVLTASRITATQDRAKLTASNAGHFPMTVERREEIEIFPESEQREMFDWMEIELEREMNDPANARKKGPTKL